MTKRERKPPGPEEQILLAGHLGYEITSMTAGVVKFQETGDVLFQEAGLLHMRALIEFFVGRASGRKPFDVWPSDFGVDWPDDLPGADEMRDHLQTLDPYLSHMSLVRGDPVLEVVGFGAGPICVEVLQLAMDFAGADRSVGRRDLRTIELAVTESANRLERADLLERWSKRGLDPRTVRPIG